MRRGPGVAGLMRGKEAKSTMGAVGEQLEATQVSHARTQLQSLRGTLSEFAKKHRSRINSDPQFRQAFCEMCVAAGVDPLASSKGLWDELLGVGQFYNELAVQVLTACLRTRDVNGGLLDVDECVRLVQKSRAPGQQVDSADVRRAVGCLSALGRGVGLSTCGGRQLLYSLPDELSADPAQALEAAALAGGRTCSSELQRRLGWPEERAEAALAFFVREGLCWVDTQDVAGGVARWCWFPSIALAATDGDCGLLVPP